MNRKPEMKKAVLSVGIAVTQLFAVGAFAQGEVGHVKPPAPAASVAPAEKAAAQAHRKAEGAAAAKQMAPGGEVGAVKPAPPAAMVGPAEKAAGKAKREAEGAAAAKAPAPGGRVGPTN